MPSGDLNEIRRLISLHRETWPDASFLRQISDAALSAIVSAARLTSFEREEPLIEEGTLATEVFFLLSSYVKVTARTQRTGEALLAIRTGGEVVGEIAVTDAGPRLATVRACGRGPVHAAVLTREDFTGTMSEYPDALMRLTCGVGAKLRTATRRRVDIAGSDPTVRLARVLVELGEDYGQPAPGRGKAIIIGVDITRLELSTLIGVAESTAQRAMRALRDQGLVAGGHRRLLIRDLTELRKAAGWDANSSFDRQ